MNPLTRFFHELFHPHCEQCAMDKQVGQINPVVENLKAELAQVYTRLENLQDSNPVVEILRGELERAYRNNDKLLEQIFDKVRYERDFVEKNVINPTPPNMTSIPSIGNRSWAARRRELEANSRATANEMARLKAEGITPVTENDLGKELESVSENA